LRPLARRASSRSNGLFTWDWRADRCAQAGLPCVLGHARSRPAIPGGQANTANIEAPKLAGRLRGGMRPQADVYPAELRATRDLWRRRMSLLRPRAALLTHVQQTTRQDNRPEIGPQLADKATREGGAARGPDPAGQPRITVDLAVLNADDRRLTARARALVHTAKAPKAPLGDRLGSSPGGGTMLALVWRDALHDLTRCPRGQAFVASGRLVQCAHASAGQRDGPAGTNMGHASRQWAFSAAAVRCVRAHPAGQTSRARSGNKHGKGQAFTIPAHQLARAVDDMGRRATGFALDPVLPCRTARRGQARRLTGRPGDEPWT
jgi:hypothetical protein